jgi:hypothetical protein
MKSRLRLNSRISELETLGFPGLWVFGDPAPPTCGSPDGGTPRLSGHTSTHLCQLHSCPLLDLRSMSLSSPHPRPQPLLPLTASGAPDLCFLSEDPLEAQWLSALRVPWI